MAAVALAALAVTDGKTYPVVNGLKITNQWIFDRVHAGKNYINNDICHTFARTATMDQGIIYVARCEERFLVVDGDSLMQSVIHRFSAVDGHQLEDLPLTLDGKPYGRYRGVASIGKDSFHHIWVAPMTGGTGDLQQYVPIYMVDTETGEMTLVVNLDKNGTKGDTGWPRTDYVDVMGDLTLEQAECNIMTVAGSTADPGLPYIYRQHADRNGTWEGGFDGNDYLYVSEYYPWTKTGFSLAPVVKMIEGQDEESRYSGELFYIDCFDTAPVVYTIDGAPFDSFEEVDPELRPKSAPNGCMEFKIDGRNFLVYARADMHGNGNGCQANICELGEASALTGMTKYWQIPADSLGKENDGGLRVHCFAVEYGTDSKGNEEVTLFTFKAYNGMAVYKITVDDGTPETTPGDVNGDGTVNISDVNAVIDCILAGRYTPGADVNADGSVNIGDINAIINIILKS